jgi:hypothetical protein
MALDDSFNIVRPGQSNQAGVVNALHLEEFTGVVESTIERKSALKGMIPIRPVRGASVLTNFAVGGSTLQRANPGGPAPDGTGTDFAKRTLTVDTVILARAILPLLETFQTSYDARKEIGLEHGKKIAKFTDQSFFIQAIKAGLLTDSAYRGSGAAGKPLDHFGGSQQTLAAAGDSLDPAKLYAAVANLFVKMEEKDVDPRNDDVMIALRPAEFYTLLQNEQLIDGTYKTAEGTNIQAQLLKAYGVPVVSSTNFPGGLTISGHLLSNANNSNAYDGDFTKVVGCAFSPRALLAGETIPLTTDVFWDKVTKQWFVDAHLAYGVTPNRAEFSGVILKP